MSTPSDPPDPSDERAEGTASTPADGAGEGAAAAPADGEAGGEPSGEPGAERSRRVGWPVAIGSGVAIATAVAALVTAFTPWLTGGGGGAAASSASPTPSSGPTSSPTPPPSPPPPTSPTVTPSPPPPTQAPDKPCRSTKAAHGFRAAFVAPCDGGSATAPYPTVTLAVPRYPAGDGSQGRLWIVSRILTDGAGMPLADEPLYGQYPVERKTADRFTATTWQKNLFVFRTCRDYGPTELSVYWLDPSGAEEAERWRPGVTITIPPHSTLLDRATVTLAPGC
ncbi:hypothetical protein [Streptomyces sp. XD-27]|uniref:hypothetical protein n=1 Tax=Streptomyces sp. XD-27 TaxID=3062779 RepID=UPI0026F445EF|nr:hypothetical protein [Streptomyces sp. XD-27]WKX73767.1 hypothetical protein Q3Y56_31315 [Streptomyces sp. XD-27]